MLVGGRLLGAALGVLAAGCSTGLDAPDSTFAPASPVRFERLLTAPHPLPHVRFGSAVALSGTGVAVAAPFENAAGKVDDPAGAPSDYVPYGEGVTYLFDLAQHGRAPLRIVAPNADPGDAQVTTEEAQLLKGSNVAALALALDEDFLVVGAAAEDSALAPKDDSDVAAAEADNSATDAGAVYVYARSDLELGRLKPRQYLKAPDVRAGDLFGSSVALSGSHLVIGAPGVSDTSTAATTAGSATHVGTVYSYELSHGRFVLKQMLKPASLRSDDAFGTAVSGDRDLLVIGASRDSSASTRIGAVRDNDTSSPQNGAAYVYRWRSSEWQLEAYLKPDIALPLGAFGLVVRVSGQRIVVSAPLASGCADQKYPQMWRGAVYVFEHVTDGWAIERCLSPGKRMTSDLFGFSLGLDANHLLVGAAWDGSGLVQQSTDETLSFSGAAYLEERDAMGWHVSKYIKAPDFAQNDVFGVSADIGPQRIVVGASQRSRDEHGGKAPIFSGAAYVFSVDD